MITDHDGNYHDNIDVLDDHYYHQDYYDAYVDYSQSSLVVERDGGGVWGCVIMNNGHDDDHYDNNDDYDDD